MSSTAVDACDIDVLCGVRIDHLRKHVLDGCLCRHDVLSGAREYLRAAVAAAVREKLCDLRDAWMLVSMSVITSSVMWCSTTATSAPSSSIGPVDDHAAADDEDAGTAFGGFGGLFGGGGDDKYEYTGE
jgi:hypothetical protein